MVKGKSPNRPAKNKSMEEIQAEMLIQLSQLNEKMADMEAALKASVNESNELKATVAKQADEIAYLKEGLNEREQYARAWSMRILNMQLPQGEESNTRVVMETIYNRLLLPILEGARASKEISAFPTCESLLESAHILPGPGKNKPIIARFYSRYWRSIVFRYRKAHAPREEAAPTNTTRRGAERTERPGRLLYTFFEDLTRATFKQLQAIKACEEVTAAWTVNGVIRFKVKNKDEIFKVSSIYDTVESLTK